MDRVVGVKKFEHMKNYGELLRRVASWLKPGGKLLVHIFTHRDIAYHFEAGSEDEWLAGHFFTGGRMPSHDLLLHFQDDLRVEEQWAANGTQYEKTANAWLDNMDAKRGEIMPLLASTYCEGKAKIWWVCWRVFFMACAELWRYRAGNEWIVSHHRFRKP